MVDPNAESPRYCCLSLRGVPAICANDCNALELFRPAFGGQTVTVCAIPNPAKPSMLAESLKSESWIAFRMAKLLLEIPYAWLALSLDLSRTAFLWTSPAFGFVQTIKLPILNG
jgi:hypothetical protein